VGKIPYTDRNGINAGNCKHSEETIRRVCVMLQNKPQVSSSVVARICKVGRTVPAAILKGETWGHVSCEYDFTERNLYNKRWGPKTRRQ